MHLGNFIQGWLIHLSSCISFKCFIVDTSSNFFRDLQARRHSCSEDSDLPCSLTSLVRFLWSSFCSFFRSVRSGNFSNDSTYFTFRLLKFFKPSWPLISVIAEESTWSSESSVKFETSENVWHISMTNSRKTRRMQGFKAKEVRSFSSQCQKLRHDTF